MTPRWEELPSPPPGPNADQLLMDATLTPNRSLSGRGLAILIAAVVAINLAFAIVMIAQGAWPVVGFLGLDIVAIWLAFHLNNQAAQRFERVQIAPDRIHVTRSSPRRRAAHYITHPAWARVEALPQAVRIAAGGRAVSLGAFLSPGERRDFAAALERALSRAKRG